MLRETDMPCDMEQAFTKLSRLVAAYEGRHQDPVDYFPDVWGDKLGDDELPAILWDDDFTNPGATAASRTVDRRSLVDLCRRIDLEDNLAVRRAFLLVMAWGIGPKCNRRPFFRFGYDQAVRALRDPECHRQLKEAAIRCRGGDVAEAYRRFRLPGVGQSYATKWFAFAGVCEGRDWQPLILDNMVIKTVNRTLRLRLACLATGGRGARYRYEGYVQQMHAWSSQLAADRYEVAAERLEWIMFDHRGRPFPDALGDNTPAD